MQQLVLNQHHASSIDISFSIVTSIFGDKKVTNHAIYLQKLLHHIILYYDSNRVEANYSNLL